MALNRKNAIFAGHDAGAENCAVIASLIETCKMNGVDPHAWLAATLVTIVKCLKQSQIQNHSRGTTLPPCDRDSALMSFFKGARHAIWDAGGVYRGLDAQRWARGLKTSVNKL